MKEIEALLIELAKRKGSKYNNIWYSDEWTNVFFETGEIMQIHACFICEQIIINKPLAQYQMFLTEETMYEHGLKHIKEAGLLTFL